MWKASCYLAGYKNTDTVSALKNYLPWAPMYIPLKDFEVITFLQKWNHSPFPLMHVW